MVELGVVFDGEGVGEVLFCVVDCGIVIAGVGVIVIGGVEAVGVDDALFPMSEPLPRPAPLSSALSCCSFSLESLRRTVVVVVSLDLDVALVSLSSPIDGVDDDDDGLFVPPMIVDPRVRVLSAPAHSSVDNELSAVSLGGEDVDMVMAGFRRVPSLAVILLALLL